MLFCSIKRVIKGLNSIVMATVAIYTKLYDTKEEEPPYIDIFFYACGTFKYIQYIPCKMPWLQRQNTLPQLHRLGCASWRNTLKDCLLHIIMPEAILSLTVIYYTSGADFQI